VTAASKAGSEIDILTALGFGPETLLTSESRIFMNARFLASLLVEIEDELEPVGARRALFQIGLLFGLRDAYRLAQSETNTAHESVAESTLLAIQFSQRNGSGAAGEIEIPGSWPEHYEAESRLSKLGPEEVPCCALSAGYTSGWLSGNLETDIFVVEEQCKACGDETCSFVARDVGQWQAEREEKGDECMLLMPELPYAEFRELSERFAHPLDQEAPYPTLDFDTSMVHVWGPVMVLPFSNVDEALHTVEMLGRDPDTSDVRTVVVDLCGEGLDEGFGAAALEQVLATIEAWGAEAILTNVSPLAEPIVADLESKHLLLRKDLPEAIAAAFQIAEAQRHLL
jgi:predicted hydrocarbon binding protein